MLMLKDAVKGFELGRASRRNRREPTPDRRRDRVRERVSYHKKPDVQKALRVSGGKLNEHSEVVCIGKPVIPASDGFAVMGSLSSESFSEDALCEMTLKGMERSLQIKVPVSPVARVLSWVEGL